MVKLPPLALHITDDGVARVVVSHLAQTVFVGPDVDETAGGEEEPRAQNEYLEVLKKRVEEARQRERDRGVFTRMRE